MPGPSMIEDMHFYIDNAPPVEVSHVLQALSEHEALTSVEIAQRVQESGYVMQKDQTYSPRRLLDLGLIEVFENGTRPRYIVSPAGKCVRALFYREPELFWDSLHFLHYTLWDGQPSRRKLLWSYRTCCEVLWSRNSLVSTAAMAAEVQNQMQRHFPNLDYMARIGARFDGTAARRCYGWLSHLIPKPFPTGKELHRRTIDRYELPLLALDHVYRARGYRYGDPVILDSVILDEVARVFFLDPLCCRNLLDVAARLTRAVHLSDTFAGTSITLQEPYNIERI